VSSIPISYSEMDLWFCCPPTQRRHWLSTLPLPKRTAPVRDVRYPTRSNGSLHLARTLIMQIRLPALVRDVKHSEFEGSLHLRLLNSQPQASSEFRNPFRVPGPGVCSNLIEPISNIYHQLCARCKQRVTPFTTGVNP